MLGTVILILVIILAGLSLKGYVHEPRDPTANADVLIGG